MLQHSLVLQRRVGSMMMRSRLLSTATLPNVTLYQYNICPFCHKAKAVMGYAGLTPRIVEVNPLSKAELKQTPDQSYRKVPIAIINDDKQVNGSDEIVHELLQMDSIKEIILSKSTSLKGGWDDFHHPSNALSESWIKFANDDLAAILYPNICSTLRSFAMYMAASRIKKKRGIVDERAALQAALQKWQDEGLGGTNRSTKKKFVSGADDPNLADLVVYGTLRSVEGLPTHNQVIMENPDNAVLKEWYLRVKERLPEY